MEFTEKYVTGTGQKILVHSKAACRLESAEHCVIHNPSEHSMRKFPTHWRPDRRLMERICPHGVGHPDPDCLAYTEYLRGPDYARTESVHGCDGCCT